MIGKRSADAVTQFCETSQTHVMRSGRPQPRAADSWTKTVFHLSFFLYGRSGAGRNSGKSASGIVVTVSSMQRRDRSKSPSATDVDSNLPHFPEVCFSVGPSFGELVLCQGINSSQRLWSHDKLCPGTTSKAAGSGTDVESDLPHFPEMCFSVFGGFGLALASTIACRLATRLTAHSLYAMSSVVTACFGYL
jgi:hypothetical protein